MLPAAVPSLRGRPAGGSVVVQVVRPAELPKSELVAVGCEPSGGWWRSYARKTYSNKEGLMSTATTTHKCLKCRDKGYVYYDGFSVRNCRNCDGEGWVYVMPTKNDDPVKVVPCRRCHGDGVVDNHGRRKACPACTTGVVPAVGPLPQTLEEGEHETRIRG